MAERDPLTDLLNRRGLEIRLGFNNPFASQSSRQIAVALIDIDHFKQINDTYSHPVGDQVLEILARLLEKYLPSSSLLCRYGGEEFLIVLYPQPRESVYDLLNHFRLKVEAYPWGMTPVREGVTVSIGVAQGGSQDMNSLIREADDQLYQAKQLGRNQVRPQIDAPAS